MAWRQSGDKPLSEPMMVSLLTHIYPNELWLPCLSYELRKLYKLSALELHLGSIIATKSIQNPLSVKIVWHVANSSMHIIVAISYLVVRT